MTQQYYKLNPRKVPKNKIKTITKTTILQVEEYKNKIEKSQKTKEEDAEMLEAAVKRLIREAGVKR